MTELKVDKSNLVPIYCVIPEEWELPELINFETNLEFLNACNESHKKGTLRISLQDELLWRNKDVAETFIDERLNACKFNKRTKLGTFWISKNTACKNMVQTSIVLLRTSHPQEEVANILKEDEIELVCVSNFLGLHKLTQTPFFVDFESCYQSLGTIAIPIHRFFQEYQILRR